MRNKKGQFQKKRFKKSDSRVGLVTKMLLIISAWIFAMFILGQVNAEPLTGWDSIKYKYWNNQYPESLGDREDYTREYLVWNSDLSNETIENLIKIWGLESTARDPKVISKSKVYHCSKDGETNWFSSSPNPCPENHITGIVEPDGWGVIQALKSTWNTPKNDCEGNIEDLVVDEQLACGIKIFKNQGYNAWYTSSVKLGIIR